MAIQLSKNGNAVRFDFDDNSHYLNDGTIEVPVNSLTLVTDESNMFTFKKAASDDIFISGLYEEIGMSKSELIAWYKDNMVGSTGGGGGGVTSGEVQTMIDESVSGKADISDVATVSGDVSLLSEQVETDEKVTATALVDLDNRKLDASAYTPTDLSNYYTKSQTNTQINNATEGLLNASTFNTYSANTNARLAEDEEVTSAALNELNEALSGKADTTAVTESINAAVSSKADTSAVTASITAAVSGKQDTLIAGSGITIDSANTISCTVEGGGKAIEAGRGIAITTGATADTVSFNLPISAGTGDNSIIAFDTNNVQSSKSLAFGSGNTFNNTNYSKNFAFGDKNTSNGSTNIFLGNENSTYTAANSNVVIGNKNSTGIRTYQSVMIGNSNYIDSNTTSAFTLGNDTRAFNTYEIASGRYNVSNKTNTTWGDSGNTLFSVGNGTDNNTRHNAFEIRQNGDIYITSGGTDIKLQDNLGGGGGGLPESAFTAYTAATEARLAEDEEVTAAALNVLSTNMGGFKLQGITQAAYDALVSGGTVDANTLYIITNVVN